MRSLYDENFAWVLMLPADYEDSHSLYLRNFKDKGGHISVIPYSVDDIHRMIDRRSEKFAFMH
jgi:hypothetical protein